MSRLIKIEQSKKAKEQYHHQIVDILLERSTKQEISEVLHCSERKAREIIAAAEVKVTELNSKLSELKTAMELYKTQASGMLNAQIDVINKFKTE